MHNPTEFNLVECLKAFNRKERYWLLRNALADPLTLSPDFLDKLRDTLGISIPPDAWWALDYHFDWLIGALLSFQSLEMTGKNDLIAVQDGEPQRRAIQGNQEDVDFVIAFDRTIILIEAKGVTSWSNEQVLSKSRRLHGLVQAARPQEIGIDIYFVLTSPVESSALKSRNWPAAIKMKGTSDRKPFFVELKVGDSDREFLRIERSDGKKASALGEFWRIFSSK